YWPGSKGEVALTAQVTSFLEQARRAGLKADDKVERRALEALQKVLRSDYPGMYTDYRSNQQTSALRALALAGKGDEHYLIDLWQRREGMDAISLADLTLVMGEQPRLFGENLKALRGELWDRVVLKLREGKTTFESVRGG